MATVAEMCSLGLQHHQAGNLVQAEQLYRQILQADPNYADAHHLLGVLAYQAGRHDFAIQSIHHAITLNPLAGPYHSNLGLAYEALGRFQEAAECYQQALRFNPADNMALANLGAVMLRQNHLHDLVALCQQVLSAQPNMAEAHQHLAHALNRQGKLDESLVHFQEALRLRPNFLEAHNNFGNLLHDVGRTEEAIAHFQQALALRPQSPEVQNNLARALHRQGKYDEAAAHYREAIRLAPDFAQAHNNLGSTLVHQHKFDEAIASYRQALSINPDFAEAHSNLGAALLRHDSVDEAVEECRQAIALQPRYAEAHNNLGGAFLEQGKLAEAAACFRRALELNPNLPPGARGNVLFCMNYDPEADPDAVFSEHRNWGQQFPTVSVPRREVGSAGSRLRIGYVSPDFRQHALLRYFEPVLTCHDATQVEVFCYSEVSQPDAATNRLQKLAHHWRWLRGLSDVQAAQLIRDDRIDILVDLAGHTAGNRLDVFALKPAPVQVTWLGYLNTTGLTTIDYRLTDNVLDPPGQPIRDTEELLRLPHGFCCFEPWPNSPQVSPLPALERGYLTFGSLHNLFKLNARVYDLWCQVLHALPTARLLMFRDKLKGSALERVRREFIKRGIDEERLDLRSHELARPALQDKETGRQGDTENLVSLSPCLPVSLSPLLPVSLSNPKGVYSPGHLHVFADIDVSLDAFPWTGGVTTCESLWMGVPMLSLVGVRPAARNSASILAQLGLDDWVCGTPDAFVARAVRVFKDLDHLAQLRATLRQRMTTTLCDARRFTRDLEEAYRTMWQRRLSANCGLATEPR